MVSEIGSNAFLKSGWIRKIYFPLVLLFIFGDIICSNYISRSFASQSHGLEFVYFMVLSLLQIVASPIQASLSDLYCRRKSLIVSLFASFASLVFVYFSTKFSSFLVVLFSFMILLKGVFGNTIPLSFAAIADVKNKKIRLSFGMATSPYTIGYFFLILTNKMFSESESAILSILIFIFLLSVCFWLFYDYRDKDSKKNDSLHIDSAALGMVKREVKSVIRSIQDGSMRMALTAYLLWEISLYSILLLYIDFNIEKFSSIAIFMLSGALFALLFLKIFEKMRDDKMIRVGYNLSAISLLPFFVFFPFVDNFNFYLLGICYFFHTMGNVLLSAALFALLAKRTPPHECGKIYGLLESVDTAAFLIASIFIIIYNILDINLICLIFFSYFSVAISWIPYARFKKIRDFNG